MFNINIYQYSKICFIDNSTFYSKKKFWNEDVGCQNMDCQQECYLGNINSL